MLNYTSSNKITKVNVKQSPQKFGKSIKSMVLPTVAVINHFTLFGDM